MKDDARCEPYQPRLIEECVSLFISVFNSPPWNDQWTQERARSWMARLSSEPPFRGFCAFSGERLVAACLGRLEMWWRGEEYHIEEMFVAADAQGKGIGSRLLAFAESELKKENVAAVTLVTGREIPAKTFYEKNGFYGVENLTFMKKSYSRFSRRHRLAERKNIPPLGPAGRGADFFKRKRNAMNAGQGADRDQAFSQIVQLATGKVEGAPLFEYRHPKHDPTGESSVNGKAYELTFHGFLTTH
ncbi:MAG: GNAT family N-acetyltransferase [Spirochaetales bacterium]|nr:GNAT family N-acetyltransferase [Spirochaetales bacterium]